MKTTITLYGALSEADPDGRVELELPPGCTIAGVREALVAHLAEHAPAISAGLVQRSAFGTSEAILHDRDPVPAGQELAALPPVGGG